jgi:hypothetical protein
VRPVLVATEAQLGFRDVTGVVGARAGGARVCDTDTSELLLNAVRGLWREGMGCYRRGGFQASQKELWSCYDTVRFDAVQRT